MMISRSLVVATQNAGKLKELRQLLGDLPLDLYGLADFPKVAAVPETGASFIENASLKAVGYATQTGQLALADDSGLEVDALGGGPGVLSARYAGEGSSELERIERLLAELSIYPETNRSARFVSAVVIASGDGRVLNVSAGECYGRIDFAPRGAGGFGYDPIFIPVGYDKTFAELQTETKNRISHRAQALLGAREFLRTLTNASGGG
jgi:XTP/dITP diphosphohydrolase